MYCSVEEAVAIIKMGGMLVVVDDENRENEGDLLMAASYATPEKINFMATHGRGLICAPITQALARQLDLPPMVSDNSDPKETAFTVSIDLSGLHTGISAFERSRTLMALTESNVTAEFFTKPGHIFPLVAKPGGVIERQGHTEAAVELAQMADLPPVGVICEIMADDGTMARGECLKTFCEKHKLKCLTIEALERYQKSKKYGFTTSAKLPTKYGAFDLMGFECENGSHHVALVMGTPFHMNAPLVRVHSECLTGDAFGSAKCDCGDQLHQSMAKIAEEGSGIILYLRQEGRGIGLINKIRAYALQDQGLDTSEANLALGFHEDLRNYSVAGKMLQALGIQTVRLMTNNPDKVSALEKEGIMVRDRIEIKGAVLPTNAFYLETKKNKMGHWL